MKLLPDENVPVKLRQNFTENTQIYSYSAIDRGPVPAQFQNLFEYITETSDIRIATQTFAKGGIGERIELENVESREGHFNESEAAILQQVVEKFGSMKTPDLIEKSHQEQAWQANAGQKQWISYKEYGFKIIE